MSHSRRWRRTIRLFIAVVLLGAVAGVGMGMQPASAARSQTPPVWCDLVPPEWRPFVPDCAGGGGNGGGGGTGSSEIEDHYQATGPWAVTIGTATAPGTPGVRFGRPTNLGQDGTNHPILTWGNGTGGTCTGAEGILRHFASWGFVIVCAESGWTGSGAEILAAARWAVAENTRAGSVFNGHLDTARVGAFGGSQGASGAVNAMLQSNGLIRSAAAGALTDPWVHIWGPPPDMTQVTRPVFLVSGTADPLTTQPQQQVYYDQVRGPAAKAAFVGAGHDLQGNDFGYFTAWFFYTLLNDDFARGAFAGSSPEILQNPAWTNQAVKGLT